MSRIVPTAPGQTPLDAEDLRDLRLTSITSRGALDAAEQAHIVSGRRWARRRARTVDAVLDDGFLRQLPLHMFGVVWRWAGRYRTRGTTIGIAPWQIGGAVRSLVADLRVPCAAAEARQTDTGAVGFHHRLVVIHPFVNGNGRHARLAADLLARALGRGAFTWGGASGPLATAEPDPVRAAYLAALRAADRGHLEVLVAFARS